MNLHDKTVLITGGRRIGAKLAAQLAQRGANIAFSYLTSGDALNAVADECRRSGVRAETFRADLRSADEAERLVEWTVGTFGSVDVLVNLTSIYTRTPFATLRPEDYEAMLTANLTAPYWVAVAAARAMQRQPVIDGLQGKIIHFTDWAVDRPYRDFLPYLIAKGGLVTLTKALAVELAPTITVNAVAPGWIQTASSNAQEIIAGNNTPVGHPGRPDEVAAAIAFLASESASYITGQLIVIDADLGGVPVVAFLDSGSQNTVGNLQLYERLKRKPELLSPRPLVVQLLSATGQTARGEFTRVPALRLGGLAIENISAVFADLHVFKLWNLLDRPAILVGIDVMRHFEGVDLDFAGRKVTFVTPLGSMTPR